MPALDYAILCDYVRADLGIAHMVAAGIDTIYKAEVPSGQNIGLLIRPTFTRNECGRPHRLEVIFQGEDGQRHLQVASTIAPEWDDSLPAGWHRGVLLGMNMGIPLPEYGLYSFEILLNDANVGFVHLRVVPPVDGPPVAN